MPLGSVLPSLNADHWRWFGGPPVGVVDTIPSTGFTSIDASAERWGIKNASLSRWSVTAMAARWCRSMARPGLGRGEIGVRGHPPTPSWTAGMSGASGYRVQTDAQHATSLTKQGLMYSEQTETRRVSRCDGRFNPERADGETSPFTARRMSFYRTSA